MIGVMTALSELLLLACADVWLAGSGVVKEWGGGERSGVVME